jgi:hypothetical protein
MTNKYCCAILLLEVQCWSGEAIDYHAFINKYVKKKSYKLHKKQLPNWQNTKWHSSIMKLHFNRNNILLIYFFIYYYFKIIWNISYYFISKSFKESDENVKRLTAILLVNRWWMMLWYILTNNFWLWYGVLWLAGMVMWL